VLEFGHPLLVPCPSLSCPAGRTAGEAQGPQRDKAAVEGDLGKGQTWQGRLKLKGTGALRDQEDGRQGSA